MRTAGALAILLGITIGLYGKLTLSDRYTWLESPDHALLIRPWLDYQARELHAGRIPLWDPYLWAGQPLHAQLEPGLANPLNWALFAWPLRDGHIAPRTLEWYWVLIHWVAAALAFWLCRDLGCGSGASLVGGAVYGFLGYMGWAGGTCFLMSCLLVPVALLFFARVWRGEAPVSNAALCGAALGGGFLSGHHNVPTYLVVVVGALWVALVGAATVRLGLARRAAVTGGGGRGGAARLWGAGGVCLATCFLVSAAQTLPTIEYGRQALRWVGIEQPLGWTDKVPYSVHAEYSIPARTLAGLVVPGKAIHASPFVGFAALALALAAVWRRWKAPEVRMLAGVAALGLLLALGGETPVHGIAYRVVPGVEKARYPAMAIVILHCAVAALAAMGVALARGRWRWALTAAALAAVVFEATTYPPPVLRERGFAGSYEATIAAQTDIAEFLRTRPGWFRVRVDERAIPYNFGDLYGVEQFGGFVPGMPARLYRAMGEPDLARRYGIRYWVGNAPTNAGQVEVFRSRSGLRVFEDARIGEPVSVWREASCGPADAARVVSRAPGASAFEAELGCAGLVVVGDPYYRGWRATVDGRRAPIQEFEGGRRAVRVEAGRHRIEFRYRPTSVYLGAALSVIGLSGCVVLRKLRV